MASATSSGDGPWQGRLRQLWRGLEHVGFVCAAQVGFLPGSAQASGSFGFIDALGSLEFRGGPGSSGFAARWVGLDLGAQSLRAGLSETGGAACPALRGQRDVAPWTRYARRPGAVDAAGTDACARVAGLGIAVFLAGVGNGSWHNLLGRS